MTKITVEIGGRTVKCVSSLQTLRFSDIIEDLEKETCEDCFELGRKALLCLGCGRRLRKEEEAFQEVPVACCRIRSLHLIDESSQLTKDATLQSERFRTSSSQQFPPPENCLLRVDVKEGINFSIDLQLRPPITVRDIRRAVAAHMNVDSRFVRLKRKTAVGPCGRSYEVFNEPEIGCSTDHDFGSEAGSIFKAKDVYDIRVYEQFDEMVFPLVKGGRCVVHAQKEDLPRSMHPFYIFNEMGQDFHLNPILPRPCKIGHIRKLLASEIKTDLGYVKLELMIGRTPSGDSCVAVCDEFDQTPFSGDRELELGDEHGNIYADETLEPPSKLVEFCNDKTEMLLVPDRRNIIYLSQRHPPAERRELYVRREHAQDIIFDPYIPKTPTVGDVRAAVAAELRMTPSSVTMRRWVGQADGKLCLHVYGHDDASLDMQSDNVNFAGAGDSHKLHEKENVECRQLLELCNDDERFLLSPSRRNVIYISHPETPASKCPLYIRRINADDVYFSPHIREPVTVRRVRVAIAEELKLHLGAFSLEQWMGSEDDYQCCHVCSEEDVFCDIQSDFAFFADVPDGFSREKQTLDFVELWELADDDEFVIVLDRRSIVYLK